MKKIIFPLVVGILFVFQMDAQCILNDQGDLENITGGPCNNTILTAVPFLRITPNARSAGMGDAGIATSADANSIHHNASKLAFADKDFAVAATYTPWLRELGVDDVFLAYLAGYKQIDENSAVTAGFRYFSLGEVQFRNSNGDPRGVGNPNEFEIAIGYTRKLSEYFSAGLTGKFVYSNLASGQMIDDSGPEINAGTSGGADISFTYKKPLNSNSVASDLTVGLAITNIGSKITYIEDLNRDFIPTNIGLGVAWTNQINDAAKITLTADVNKLMVPTPIPAALEDEFDVDPADGVADFRQKSLFSGILGSFSDAPDGDSEFNELYYSIGGEFWYNETFALRAGYFSEHQTKGGRQYLTAGAGLKLEDFGINFSYLIPTTIERSALDNTLRFTLLFDRGAFVSDNN